MEKHFNNWLNRLEIKELDKLKSEIIDDVKTFITPQQGEDIKHLNRLIYSKKESLIK